MGARNPSGEGGSRTHGTGLSPYDGLANRSLRPLGHLSQTIGGGSRIRTHGARLRSAVFKTAAFDHSAIPPNPLTMPQPRDIESGKILYRGPQSCQSLFIGPYGRFAKRPFQRETPLPTQNTPPPLRETPISCYYQPP